MIGILVELLLNWLLLWLVCRKHLSALGLLPSRKRLAQFGTGLLLAALCCAAYQLLSAAPAGNRWRLNPDWGFGTLLSTLRWMAVSVLYEELIFRGALLYIGIRKWGWVKACLWSAAAFGVYHWFSYGVFGQAVPMAFVFLLTATHGFLYAAAFARTASLYLPTALHLGWNLVATALFSNGPLGLQLLVKQNANAPQGGWWVLLLLFQLLALPLLVARYLKRPGRSVNRSRR